MVLKSVRHFAIGLAVLACFLVLIIKSNDSNNQRVQSQAEAMAISTLISSVDLLLIEKQAASRQGLSALLQSLDNIPEVVWWRLLDSENQLLSEKFNTTEKSYLEHHFYFETNRGQLITLEVGFLQPVVKASAGYLVDAGAILLLVASVLSFLYYRFGWLFSLESYASKRLTSNSPVDPNLLPESPNPVARLFNQLVLNNARLEKDKLELTEQIRKISYVDEITELGNSLFFKAEFEVRLHNHEEPESGIVMLLSFVESDRDTQLIFDENRQREVANILRHFSHRYPDALVAKLKENDFALLLPNQTEADTDKLCKKLLSQLDKGIFDQTSIKNHFVDIGISAYKQGFDYYKVLAEADMALRNSQLQGGNCWFMYGEALAKNKVKGSIQWRSFLQRILDKRQLRLYGQKIHYLLDESVEHYEILARIEDGDDILSADTFLPMANQCGLAAEFDRQIVDGVIKHCVYQEHVSEKYFISVNLFISSLLDEKFVSWLIGKLSSYPELCAQLSFEVREAHVTHNLVSITPVLKQLADLGVNWCIKRFGAPDESIDYIEELPVKRVKIDRRIVHDIYQNKPQQLLFQSLLINMKSKNIEIFAGAVEKEKDAEYLADSGITAVQGYYYSPPKRLKRIEGYLKAS